MGAEQLPFLLLFLSFLGTFLTTRTITRMIRAGVGPFRNNVSGGVHIHHAVPGIILTLIGAYLSVAVGGARPWAEVAGVLIGSGSSLILDEFALILHLEDVYWSPQGQLSVQLVALTVSVLGLVTLGLSPLTSDQEFGLGHLAVAVTVAAHLVLLLVCVRKGKYSTAVLGVFLPPVSWIGAVRLARPGSTWARRRYDAPKAARAKARADGFDARFGRWGLELADLVAGRPSLPNPVGPGSPPSSPAGDGTDERRPAGAGAQGLSPAGPGSPPSSPAVAAAEEGRPARAGVEVSRPAGARSARPGTDGPGASGADSGPQPGQ